MSEDILNVGNKILIGGRSENTKHRTTIIIITVIIFEQFFRFQPDGRDDVVNLYGFLHCPGSLLAATSATKASSALCRSCLCFWHIRRLLFLVKERPMIENGQETKPVPTTQQPPRLFFPGRKRRGLVGVYTRNGRFTRVLK